jgi:uncharacterized protein YegP (UPF0339 family)
MYRIMVFKGRRKWYWHLEARNGQVVLTSQGYFSKWNAKRSAKKHAQAGGYEWKVEEPEIPNRRTRRELKASRKRIEAGEVSGPYHSADEMIDSLYANPKQPSRKPQL